MDVELLIRGAALARADDRTWGRSPAACTVSATGVCRYVLQRKWDSDITARAALQGLAVAATCVVPMT
jgi:hypothetical protein